MVEATIGEDALLRADAAGEDQRTAADVGPDVEDCVPWPDLSPHTIRCAGLVDATDGQFLPVRSVQAYAVAQGVRHLGAERCAHKALGGADDPKAGEPVTRQASSG